MPSTTRSFSLPLPLDDGARLLVSVERCPVVVTGIGVGEKPSLEVRGHRVDAAVVRFGGRVRNNQHMLHVGIDEDEGGIDEVLLRVPRDVALWVESELGPVRVSDLEECYLSVETEVGGIELRNVAGHLHLATEIGPIRGEAVGGRLQVETEVGPVLLRVTHLTAGRHDVATEVGPINLELAPGLSVAIHAECDCEPISVTYPSTVTAAAQVRLTSEVGPIHVGEWRGAPATASPAPAPRPVGAGTQPPPEPGDEVARILHMVQDGVLTAAEANQLLHEIERG